MVPINGKSNLAQKYVLAERGGEHMTSYNARIWQWG